MIVSINQPAYLPWLGYFDRIARSDLHIVFDDVKIERNTSTSFTNRNKIRTAQGWAWLTVPIRRLDEPDDEIINRVQVDGSHWANKHLRSIVQSYSRAPHFAEHRDWLEGFYSRPQSHLAPLLRESTEYLLDALGIGTPLLYSSEMKVDGQKSELVLNLCKSAGASTYLSGPFGRDYLDVASFEAAGIKLKFDDYEHPIYPQLHAGFQPYMSVIDLLFNCGDASLQILQSK